MEADKKYMRFLAACFVMSGGASVKVALQQADLLLEELENEKDDDGGIASVVPKRTRKRNNSGDA
jgi:hypothetical protein